MMSRGRALWLPSVLLGLALAISMPPVSQADGPLSVVTNVPLASKAHGVALQNNLAYVATEAGLTILDVVDPENPEIVSVLPPSTLWRSQALDVSGDYVYLAGQSAGLIVVDVSNAAAPVVVGRRAVPGGLWDVAVKGNVVYGASIAGGDVRHQCDEQGHPRGRQGDRAPRMGQRLAG